MHTFLNYLKAANLGKLEGTLVCFVSIIGLTFLFGWIPVPVIGFFVALYLGGVIGGLVARSVEDGIIAGFVGGLLGSIITSILLIVFQAPSSPTYIIYFLGDLIGGDMRITLVLISVPFALISCIGGALGGAINKEAPSRRCVSPSLPPVPPRAPPSIKCGV